ncbi:NinB protein [Aminobacter sp. MSH1]|uniref:recombination protein NinB n=1 Tax=Aminobacter sp. MSH1 TaxID=374606 RepID=UPI000D3CAD7D|nr:recombination protein NinB [Aminobacter sp. MSH1]AWC25401.1 NinB protein [Aminobacter sp. MSH1]
MTRALLVLNTDADRKKVTAWAWSLPPGTRCEFKAPKRSLDQNARMWAALTDIATQVTYRTLKLTPDDWKLVFLDALKREVRIVPNLDGTGFVSLTKSSSDLSKQEMSDLLEIIQAWAAQNGVVLHDERVAA